MSVLKVAIIIGDERETHARHELPEPYFGSAPSTLLAGLKQMPGVEVHIISCVRRPVREPGKLAENIFYHALQVPRWGFLRTAYLPCVFKIRNKLRELRPDMVHGQGTEAYYALAAAHSGFPNVITIHGNMRQVARAMGARPFSFHWLTARLESWALRRTGGVVCLTHYALRQVESLARRTWLVPNAVDEDFFTIERAPAEPPTILCVADVLSLKNQNGLIRALDPITSERNLRLVFLGRVRQTDPYGAEFLELVKARPWCVYEGFKKGEALRAAFRAAHLIVLPTREDNCPMVVLEAMAAGLPVAASRIGGIPDLIDDGVNGLLFDPNDADGMRAAVLRLLSDSQAASSMAAAGRKRAREHHHPVEIARRHLEIYREVAGSSG